MDKKNIEKLGKFIALILRHKPETIGITLDEHGWANVKELISGINASGRSINMKTLIHIVDTDNKQRYSFNENKTKIRANQGHSVKVDVQLKEVEPPEYLYHGTATRFMDSIIKEGLKPMKRLHVHLFENGDFAKGIGERHGNPVVIQIRSGDMYRDGIKFYLSENGVWLTNEVLPKYFESYNY